MSRVYATAQVEKLVQSLPLHASIGGGIRFVPSHITAKRQSSRHNFHRVCMHFTWKYLDCVLSVGFFLCYCFISAHLFRSHHRSYALFVRYCMNWSLDSNCSVFPQLCRESRLLAPCVIASFVLVSDISFYLAIVVFRNCDIFNAQSRSAV